MSPISPRRLLLTDASCTSDMETVSVANVTNVAVKSPSRMGPRRPKRTKHSLKSRNRDDMADPLEINNNVAAGSGDLWTASGGGHRWIEDVEFRPFHRCPTCGARIRTLLLTDTCYTPTSDIAPTVSVADIADMKAETPRRKDPERPRRKKRSRKNHNRDDGVQTWETKSNVPAESGNLWTAFEDGRQWIEEIELQSFQTCPTCGAMAPAFDDSRFRENQRVPLKECCSFLRNTILAAFMCMSLMAALYIAFSSSESV